ncbi:GntR family transcriptional regulator [Leucobacter massiliensis]|nr:GntR family transcriptional regulator [Leucobacter massiliensis]
MEWSLEETKADRAYRELRSRLIMLEIPPGAAINELALSLELDLGRTPIREALKRLENDHLVVSYSRRGTFATNVDITDLAAISEVRQVLEPLAARHAANSLREEQQAEFEAVISELEGIDPAENKRGLLEYDLTVHRLIYHAIDNHHLAETLERLDDLATRIWCLVRDRIPDISGHITEHIDLLSAILDGDSERAAQLAGDHVRNFEATVRTVL